MTREQEAFAGFSFQLGAVVIHRGSGRRGVITNRVLVQSQTANTGHAYMVDFGDDSPAHIIEVSLRERTVEEMLEGV